LSGKCLASPALPACGRQGRQGGVVKGHNINDAMLAGSGALRPGSFTLVFLVKYIIDLKTYFLGIKTWENGSTV